MSVHDSRLLGLCDGKLQTEDGYTFEIHRHTLARKSEYFCSMFCGIGKNRREFTIPGISGSCLREILTYIYADEFRVTEQNVAELLEATDYIQMKDLYLQIKQSCMGFINVGNCLDIFHIAYLINDEDIFRKCFRLIETKLEEIVCTQLNDLANLPLEHLEKILKSRSLWVYSETTVWLPIVEWLQKDVSTRLHCAPQLLTCLAGQDLDEKLATEILQHEMISQNFMEDLGEVENAQEFSSNFERLVYYIAKGSSSSKSPLRCRIPTGLHVITVYNEKENKSDLYITYDENIDLYRKSGEISDFQVLDLKVVGHKAFLFPLDRNGCAQFDLLDQQWVPMAQYRNVFIFYSVVAIEKYVYLLGKCGTVFGMEIYDTESDRWYEGVSLRSVRNCDAATVSKKIYAIGISENLDEMSTQMFDPVSQTWTVLSPPPNVILQGFSLLECKEKLYLVGGYVDGNCHAADVFDPQTNLWSGLPHLPMTTCYIEFFFVWKKQLHVHFKADGDNSEILCWNEAQERWKDFEATNSLINLNWDHFISTFSDVNAIRVITKRNRDPSANLEKSPFC